MSVRMFHRKRFPVIIITRSADLMRALAPIGGEGCWNGLRVIAGTRKGRRLRTVRGSATRPTGDRVRESLFGILGPSVRGSRFLDLFAGTGSVGIEALSRDAESAVFVERERAAQRVLRQNLAELGFGPDAARGGRPVATVLAQDVFSALDGAAARLGPYDTVFIDPPYAKEWGARLLERFTRPPSCLSPEAWVVLQHGRRETVPEALSGLERFRFEAYGETVLSFYVWKRGG